MKKLVTLSLLALLCTSGFSQQVELLFTGRDVTTNTYVQLTRIEIKNLTQGWTEYLTFPDTMAVLFEGAGIEENADNVVFGLSQNNPNPFSGCTDVNLSVVEPGTVTMEITDINGKIVETYVRASLQPGTHQFRVNVAATGVYFLTARQNGKTSSVKMVNNGNGTKNGIEYVGDIAEKHGRASLQPQPKNGTRGIIPRAFAYGDRMSYTGFAERFGGVIEGVAVVQPQSVSENITLMVDYSTYVTPHDGYPCPAAPTVSDTIGNVYNTVQIGTQCWMRDNLRTQRYADDVIILMGHDTSYTVPYRYRPDDDVTNLDPFGYLYNWKAVMRNSSSSNANPSGVQGVCPNGWHVPSDAEWTQLTDYVSSQSSNCCHNNPSSIAKALASTTGWVAYTGSDLDKACYPGYHSYDNNASGFNATAAGYYFGEYLNFGYNAYFWSSTEVNSTTAYIRSLNYYDAVVSRVNNNKFFGYSVRCVLD